MTKGGRATFFATSGEVFPSFPCKRESIRESIRLFVCQTPSLPREDRFPLSRE